MIDPARAREIADDWIAAWNAHDLEAILAHYPDRFTFVSPLVVRRLQRDDGTIRTKAELREYFAQSLGPDSTLRFTLVEVLSGVSSVTVLYRNHRDQTVAETMILDDDHRVVAVYVHHRSG